MFSTSGESEDLFDYSKVGRRRSSVYCPPPAPDQSSDQHENIAASSSEHNMIERSEAETDIDSSETQPKKEIVHPSFGSTHLQHRQLDFVLKSPKNAETTTEDDLEKETSPERTFSNSSGLTFSVPPKKQQRKVVIMTGQPPVDSKHEAIKTHFSLSENQRETLKVNYRRHSGVQFSKSPEKERKMRSNASFGSSHQMATDRGDSEASSIATSFSRCPSLLYDRRSESNIDPLNSGTCPNCHHCSEHRNSMFEQHQPIARNTSLAAEIAHVVAARVLPSHDERKLVEDACCRIIVVVVCVQVALGITINCISLNMLWVSDILVDLISAPIWAGIPLFLSGGLGVYLTSRQTVIKKSCSLQFSVLIFSYAMSLTAVLACIAASVLTGMHAARIRSYSQCIPSTSLSSHLVVANSNRGSSDAFLTKYLITTTSSQTKLGMGPLSKNLVVSNATSIPKSRSSSSNPTTTLAISSTSTFSASMTTDRLLEFTTRYPGELLCVCKQQMDPASPLVTSASSGNIFHYYYGHHDCKAIFHSLKDQLVLLCLFNSIGSAFSLCLIFLIVKGAYASEAAVKNTNHGISSQDMELQQQNERFLEPIEKKESFRQRLSKSMRMPSLSSPSSLTPSSSQTTSRRTNGNLADSEDLVSPC